MKFNNLEEIQAKFANDFVNIVGSQDDLRRVVGNKVSKKVMTEVYDKNSNPVSYKRRGVDDGLADPDNVELTSLQTNGQAVYIAYENLTEGVDTLTGEYLTDTIEEGISDNWNNPNGVWSRPRPFIEPAIEELKSETEVRDALVVMLRNSGYDAK